MRSHTPARYRERPAGPRTTRATCNLIACGGHLWSNWRTRPSLGNPRALEELDPWSQRQRLGVTKGGLAAVGPYPIFSTNPLPAAMLGILCRALTGVRGLTRGQNCRAHGPSKALFPHPRKALSTTPDEGSRSRKDIT